MPHQYVIIAAASGWGAQLPACEEGPIALLESGVLERLASYLPLCQGKILYPTVSASGERAAPIRDRLGMIALLNKQLADALAGLNRGIFPIILGGDHSIAVGTWSGIAARQQFKKLGLIWIDAHMDAHTPETTPSGAWHGMPLAALLGYGADQFCHLKSANPILKPENVCLIGTRSYEEGEAALLHHLSVRIYTIQEVRERGLQVVLQEAIVRVASGTEGFGVSLDVDVLDPQEAPGVGSPERGGLAQEELLAALPLLSQDPRFIAFEMVEFNPQRDFQHKTLELCLGILEALFKKHVW
jgi:arginase